MPLNPNPSESLHCDTEPPPRLPAAGSLDIERFLAASTGTCATESSVRNGFHPVMCDAVISAAGHFATFSLIFNSQKHFKRISPSNQSIAALSQFIYNHNHSAAPHPGASLRNVTPPTNFISLIRSAPNECHHQISRFHFHHVHSASPATKNPSTVLRQILPIPKSLAKIPSKNLTRITDQSLVYETLRLFDVQSSHFHCKKKTGYLQMDICDANVVPVPVSAFD